MSGRLLYVASKDSVCETKSVSALQPDDSRSERSETHQGVSIGQLMIHCHILSPSNSRHILEKSCIHLTGGSGFFILVFVVNLRNSGGHHFSVMWWCDFFTPGWQFRDSSCYRLKMIKEFNPKFRGSGC